MIAIVLPAYNEELSIISLIEHIRRVAKKRLSEGILIIVVDDGSVDNTVSRVESLKGKDIAIVKHAKNRGLGEAIKTGLRYALKISPDIDTIITMDSDNTHTPGLILRMVMAIDEGYDVVIASRYQHGSRTIGLSWERRLFSLGLSLLFRVFLPIPGVRDYSCGYRAYRAELLQHAFSEWGDQFISQSGFSCMVDILFKLHRMQALITEVPMILRYDYKEGNSKMDIRITIRETLKLALNEKRLRVNNRKI